MNVIALGLTVIALVGIDGSGKTTQTVRLAEALRATGVTVYEGHNPGGRRWMGRAAQRLGGSDPAKVIGRRGVLVVELVLRWLAIARSLLKAKARGSVVVMDRYSVCQEVSVRVHGGGPVLQRLVRLAYSVFPEPQVFILLNVSPEVAYQRIERRATDHEELSFLRAASAAYIGLTPGAIRVAADRPQDEVAQAIWTAVRTGEGVMRLEGRAR